MTSSISTSAPRSTGTGWLAFGGLMIFLIGASNVLAGCAALWKNEYYVASANDLLVLDFTAWGWIWLIIGLLEIFTGISVCLGRMWAREVGVVLAVLSAIGHLAYLAAFPLWSLATIGLCILVIYALTAPPRPSPDEPGGHTAED